MPTSYTRPDANTETYTRSSKSDYTAGSAARFGEAKFNVARFGQDINFTPYTKVQRNDTTYTKPAQS